MWNWANKLPPGQVSKKYISDSEPLPPLCLVKQVHGQLEVGGAWGVAQSLQQAECETAEQAWIAIHDKVSTEPR